MLITLAVVNRQRLRKVVFKAYLCVCTLVQSEASALGLPCMVRYISVWCVPMTGQWWEANHSLRRSEEGQEVQ